MTGAIPPAPATGCPGLEALNPLCQIGGLAGAGVNAILQGVVGWVVNGATWLLDQIGGVLSSTTSVDLTARWFSQHYQTMLALAAAVIFPFLLAAVVQSVLRQQPGPLLRSALVHLPLALLLSGVAVELVRLALATTDALSSWVSSGSGTSLNDSLGNISNAMLGAIGGGHLEVPAFVLGIGSLLVAMGGFFLWVELLVRAAAVYLAVLFLPLALASLVWPAISHWSRRLVDTLVALILSKLVIVAALSLALGALSSGPGFASVLGGAALLLLATFTPFTLLRLIPALEAGAIHHLEGARHRVQQAALSGPRSAAMFALSRIGGGALHEDVGPGIGLGSSLEAPGEPWVDGLSGGEPPGLGGSSGGGPGAPPGPGGGGRSGGDRGAGDGGGDPLGIPMWPGEAPPADLAAFLAERVPAHRGPPPIYDEAEPPPAGDRASTSSSPRPTSATALAEQAQIERDEMGPVIRWPPAGAPPGAVEGRSGPGTGGDDGAR